jgi:hypothetical protein
MRSVRLLAPPLFALVAGAVAACGSSTIADVCGPEVTCPMGGTFKLCTRDQAASAFFETSDGQTLDCVSPTDCSAARRQAATWCDAH